ncbi:MAG: TIR domain-containing protein [Candidatus Lokiarchaeota archaeon]|nr:TIR domain-containing protein [Candidatus Lokiarchaeota archaeon]MBD3338658.1 TIR domain-containing protein [Candidatus Lokiarchaeota archaeon]
MNKNNISVFISYSHEDKSIVKQICSELDLLNIPFFLDEKDIDWGQTITSKVETGIRSCTHLLVIISPASFKSQWVSYEIGIAKGLGLNILPFLTHVSQESFPFIRDFRYTNKIEDVRAFFKKYASDKNTLQFNPKPYSIQDYEINEVYLMFGNHTSQIEIDARYVHQPIDLPEDLSKIYSFLAGQAEVNVKTTGAQYFNGPNTRLIRFTEENTFQSPGGKEQKGATLELGPVSWENYTVLNDFLDYKLESGKSIREEYADPETLYMNDRDLRWCKLSNILGLAIIPITKDGFGLIQKRNPRGVSSEGDRLTSGIAENIHRYLDEASSQNLSERLNELDLPSEVNKSGKVDENYKPKGVPSPILTAQRGLWEEISEELYHITNPESYKFLNIGFELTKFHPMLFGIVELNIDKNEVEKLRKSSPGRDHSEFLDIYYLPLDLHNQETSKILFDKKRWISAGLASFITAVHYWSRKEYAY